MSLKLSPALALLLPISLAAQAPALSPTERAIVKAVDARNADALALLERVVNVNSGTRNFGGVRRVGEMFRARLDSLGFTTRWVEGDAFGRAGHLVAEHVASGPKVLLIGHLDTVFERSSPFRKFERIDDSTARGPGIIDMKGGDVIIVQALAALKDAGALDALNVVVVMNGDEEDAGTPLAEARRALVEAAKGAAAAIGFEDGAGDPRTAVVSRRGSTSWTLRTQGNAGHASQIFNAEIGAGAVFEASRILNQFYTTLSGERYLAFNPGLVAGGSEVEVDSGGSVARVAGKSNVVGREVLVTGDMRTVSPEQLARAEKAMRAIVARHLPQTTAEITFDPEGYPPMAPSEGNRRLLAMYDRASRDVGAPPMTAVDPSRAGAADIAFVASLVPMKIDGVGLSGHDDHSDKETADLRMLPVQTKRAALVLYRLGSQASGVGRRQNP